SSSTLFPYTTLFRSLLSFSRVLKSGTFFRSGGTISSFLGCGGSGLTSFFQRLLDGSTTLLSLTDGVFGIGRPEFPTSVTLVLSLDRKSTRLNSSHVS